ncbi:ArdC-like ssDNA-binding domain-containing protein [Bacillus salipaludis]|uniref:ArdC-like ssDNA-binding domain-containing protein n=1 Tax=Bacillus salipaludis TaxID=2547811 RepID=UPI001AA06575|nr:ArdC-like ssDNA-binding domain-containing protein [Bacillus salipaludis]
MTNSVYEIVTNKIIEKLEQGVVPWQKLNRLYLEENTLSNLMAYILFFNTYWNL